MIDAPIKIRSLIAKSVADRLTEAEQNILFEYFQDVKNFDSALGMFTQMLGMNHSNKYSGLDYSNCSADCRKCVLDKRIKNICPHIIFQKFYDNRPAYIPSLNNCAKRYQNGRIQIITRPDSELFRYEVVNLVYADMPEYLAIFRTYEDAELFAVALIKQEEEEEQ